jgi:hypothetical protein
VLELRGSFRKALVVNLSSSFDEEDLIANILRDEEFARRLFGNLNRDVLGPPGDGKIIILNDIEVAPSSVVRSPASTAFVDDANSTYKSNTPDQATGGCSSDGDEAGSP